MFPDPQKQPIGPSRRCFLQAAAGQLLAASVLGHDANPPSASPAAGRYANLPTEKYLTPFQVVTKIEDREVFTEGPAIDSQGKVLFTNVPASKILKWDPDRQQLEVFRENSHQTNGLCFDPEGRLLACEGGAGRVTRTDLRTGRREVLAEKFGRFPLPAPNDLCLDDRGRIYFTSRPGSADPAEGNVNAVYRIDTDGTLHQVLAWPNVHMPNGIDIAPDGKTLYLVESHPDAGHHRDIRAYELLPDGTPVRGRVLIDFYPGRSGDGLCLDVKGNLYIAAGLHKTRGTSETLDTRPGIHVVSPAGQLLAFRETPEDTITNCTFGGPDQQTLYVTCGSLLLSARSQIPGYARRGG